MNNWYRRSAQLETGNSWTVLVVGLGFVGLPIALRAVAAGLSVIAYDRDLSRIMQIEQCKSYIDDIADSELLEAMSTNRLIVVRSLSGIVFDIAVIAVSSTHGNSGPDLSQISSASISVGDRLKPGSLVILESTSYPGTTDDIVRPILDAQSGLVCGRDYFLGYSPDRIDPGNRQFGLANTPKVVAGTSHDCLARVVKFYQRLVDTVVPVSSTRQAEFVKLIENTQRMVNISLVNELAIYAHATGLDIWEALDAAATKPFGYTVYNPGPGAGGPCLPKDTRLLAWHASQNGEIELPLVQASLSTNDRLAAFVVRRAEELLIEQNRELSSSTVLIAGVSYKANSRDLRGSPAHPIITLLQDRRATVVIYDPVVSATSDRQVLGVLSDAIVEQADLVIITTDHDALDYTRLAQASLILDTRHRLTGDNVYYP